MEMDYVLRFRNIICVLEDVDLMHIMLFEGHESKFTLPPIIIKLY